MIFSDSSYGELPISSTEHMFLTSNGEVIEISLNIEQAVNISLVLA
jgi:hypothetical protein